LCIVVPLPPGKYPLAVSNDDDDDDNNNNNNNNNKQLLNNLKERRGCWKLKQEVLDGSIWKTRF
jgi:hypothetical protein